MSGRVESGQLVTLAPAQQLTVGKVVLVRVKGNVYLHLVKAIRQSKNGERYLIGNNRGRLNGWVGRHSIYGVMLSAE
jgi:hypothetical protein